jgi:hypothetical protein
VVDHHYVVEDNLGGRIQLLHLDRRRHWLSSGRLKMRDVDRVLAGYDPSDGYDFLANRGSDLFSVDQNEIIGATAIVALQHHETCFPMPVPHHVAGGVLYEQIKIVGMVVGPIHGDDKFSLRIGLAVVGLGSDRQKCDKK